MTRKRHIAALAALAAMLSCAPAPPPVDSGPRAAAASYADAGRSCTDSDQCAGRCLFDYGGRAYSLQGDPPAGPAAGRCEAQEGTLGCLSEVRNGRVQRPVCAD